MERIYSFQSNVVRSYHSVLISSWALFVFCNSCISSPLLSLGGGRFLLFPLPGMSQPIYLIRSLPFRLFYVVGRRPKVPLAQVRNIHLGAF
ncbi:hypothetical protein L208DRAFT_866818 [Tricholoma matsutake]|nr:hypothetical protein L208DRAFT_866818 [Tricholoma matsutake 945]